MHGAPFGCRAFSRSSTRRTAESMLKLASCCPKRACGAVCGMGLRYDDGVSRLTNTFWFFSPIFCLTDLLLIDEQESSWAEDIIICTEVAFARTHRDFSRGQCGVSQHQFFAPPVTAQLLPSAICSSSVVVFMLRFGVTVVPK